MRLKKIINIILEYEQRVFVLLFAVFFIGLIFGGFSAFDYCNDNFTQNIYEQFFPALFDYLKKNILIFILLFILGYTAFAVPFLLILILYSGICNGVFLSFVVFGGNIISFVVLPIIIFPYFFLIFISQIYVSFSSFKLSISILNVFKKGTRFISPQKYLIPHIIKFCFFIFIIILSCLLFVFCMHPIILKIL